MIGILRMDFIQFPKIARLSRECVITEKIDGTNASIHITEDGQFLTASRTQFITPEKDNYGFSRWAHENKNDLMRLGVGSHFGEWWGQGIQRNYSKTKKEFWLFNTSIWYDELIRPSCCGVVPVLYRGEFDTNAVISCLRELEQNGSKASPGFMKPEGVVIYHTASRTYFKKTIEKDEQPKSHNV